jgi:hypothetical protein
LPVPTPLNLLPPSLPRSPKFTLSSRSVIPRSFSWAAVSLSHHVISQPVL